MEKPAAPEVTPPAPPKLLPVAEKPAVAALPSRPPAPPPPPARPAKTPAPKVAAAPRHFIEAITVSPGPTFVKVAIDGGTHPFVYKSAVLSNPNKLVIDISGLNGTKTKRNIATNSAPIKSIRVARSSSDSTRVVIDFSTSAVPRYIISRVGNGLSILIQKP